MQYRATGVFFVSANSIDELGKRCKHIMCSCPEISDMDVYGDNEHLGTMSRDIVYIPNSAGEISRPGKNRGGIVPPPD